MYVHCIKFFTNECNFAITSVLWCDMRCTGCISLVRKAVREKKEKRENGLGEGGHRVVTGWAQATELRSEQDLTTTPQPNRRKNNVSSWKKWSEEPEGQSSDQSLWRGEKCTMTLARPIDWKKRGVKHEALNWAAARTAAPTFWRSDPTTGSFNRFR